MAHVKTRHDGCHLCLPTETRRKSIRTAIGLQCPFIRPLPLLVASVLLPSIAGSYHCHQPHALELDSSADLTAYSRSLGPQLRQFRDMASSTLRAQSDPHYDASQPADGRLPMVSPKWRCGCPELERCSANHKDCAGAVELSQLEGPSRPASSSCAARLSSSLSGDAVSAAEGATRSR